MPFDRQRGTAVTDKRARCLDSIQQTTSFLTDVVDPFAKVSVGGPFAVPFQPDIMGIGGIDKRQYQNRGKGGLEHQHRRHSFLHQAAAEALWSGCKLAITPSVQRLAGTS